jgi:tetratricopeptide (TPR) repeat protein
MNKDKILYKEKIATDMVFSAWEALQKGFIPQALNDAKQALNIWKDCGDAYNIMAAIALDKKDFSEASRLFETARKKIEKILIRDKVTKKDYWSNPKANSLFKTMYGLGLVSYLQGNLEGSLKEFSELLKLDPNDRMGVCYILGEIYHKLGNFSKATEFYLNTLNIPVSIYNYSLLLFTKKDLDNAVLHLRKGFFSNIYIPSILLGAKAFMENASLNNSLSEVSYAQKYVEHNKPLWSKTKNSFKFLISVWEDYKVKEELQKFINVKRGLTKERGIKRFEIINIINEMKLSSHLLKNNHEIANRIWTKINLNKL